MVSLQKNNMGFGITISSIIVFLCYILTITFPLYFGAQGDIFVIPGTIVGCYISFKYRNEHQTFMRLGIIVGIGGAVLSTILIAFYYFIFFPDLVLFFLIIVSIIIFYVLFGFTTGYIMAMIYLRKEEKSKEIPSEIKGLDLLEEE